MSSPLYSIDDLWSGKLSVVPRPRGYDWLVEEVAEWKRAGIDTVVSLLTGVEMREFGLMDECARCSESGVSFISFPIDDMNVPRDVEAAIELVHSLEQKLNDASHIAIHCRQSIGRSGLIAASLMVMHGEKVDEVVANLSEMRGRPVPETDEQLQWLRSLASRLEKPAAKRS
jgi:protein-tyrosine phosphatase